MGRKQDLHDRLSRARSWIEAAGALSLDQRHAAFVFLFIAFNALYGRRHYEGSEADASQDREEFLRRLRILHDYDLRCGKGTLLKALKAGSKPGSALIKDTFLRNRYWRRQAKTRDLAQQFARLASQAETSLEKGQYDHFLDLVLERLTVLRNQIMHGCATFGPGSKGFRSLENGLLVLRELVPAFHKLMSDYGQHVDWPPVPYPRVGSERHPAIDQFDE